jgi:hypothetical protein
VFFLEHYFASKSLAAVRKAFGSAYPDKEVPNKNRNGDVMEKRVSLNVPRQKEKEFCNFMQ